MNQLSSYDPKNGSDTNTAGAPTMSEGAESADEMSVDDYTGAFCE